MLPIASSLVSIVLAVAPGDIDAALRQDPTYERARRGIVERAFPDGDEPFDVDGPGSKEVFEAVVGTDLFLHEEIGPFDLYVMQVDTLSDPVVAQETLDMIAGGLQPLLGLMERFEPGEGKLIGGRRFPIVITMASTAGQSSFDQLIALLDWCDWSGWKADTNLVWSASNRRELTVRTWEAQLFNVGDARAYNAEEKKNPHKPFYEHGVGYYTVAHLTALLLRKGVKADIMPFWFQQGLIDELDIAAYGEAWVGGDWWEKRTAGWYNPGFSGFLPAGTRPPPAPTAPPLDGRVTLTKGGDSWQHRDFSGTRHWDNLVADMKLEDPVSLRAMKDHETLFPRDRAYARCVLHILLDLAPREGHAGFLQAMDRVASTPASGMPDAPPFQLALSDALGGIEEVNELSELSMEELLEEVGQDDIIRRIKDLGAGEMLRFSDHREQAEWLYTKNDAEIDWDTRVELWNYIMTAEWYEQLLAWEYLSDALDRGAHAVLKKVTRYPTKSRDLDKVRKSFWGGVES